MGNNAGSAAGGGAIYGSASSGAWVYYWQQAGRFLGVRLRDLPGAFWPAYLVYEALAALGA